jgi:thymidylate synthase
MLNSLHLVDDVYLSKHRLLAGDLTAPVALCALWKDLTKVTFDDHARSQLALAGNLYTLRGIGLLLRGLWRLPSLRHVIIWGPDTLHTGEALLNLWAEGISDGHTVNGTEVELDPALPRDAIDHLRAHVQLHDLRKQRNLDSVMELATTLEPASPHATPQTFPEPDIPTPDTLPSLGTGFRVSAPRVADAWSLILDRVLRYGAVKDSQYDMPQRELLNLTTIVTDEDPNVPHLPDFLPLSAEALARYTPSITEGTPPDGISYTYGHRLRGHFGLDQVDMMVDKLAAAPHTRRATAVLWDPRTDPALDTPPCLTQVVASVVGERLFFTYVARSQDVFGAWPQNTLAMHRVQADMAARLGLAVGPITSLTISAHLYAHDWTQAEEVVSMREKAHHTLSFDPQGNILIRVEDGQIVVELLDPGGLHILWHTSGTDSRDLGNQIAASGLASLPAHYVYVGRELQRAEETLKRGETYIQDKA